ncbi:MAG: zinc ribbon domain-containing protein [Acidobacteriota bacterium]
MPIYEYVCKKCGHHLEVMQKMSDKPLSRCPKCRGGLEKVFSQTSFQLKGSGWYVNDYGKRNSPTAEKGETPAKTETGESADKSEKSEKTEKPEKSTKAEKPGKKEPAVAAKTDAPGKTD